MSNSKRAPRWEREPSHSVPLGGEISIWVKRREVGERWLLEVREGLGRRVGSTRIVSFPAVEVEEEEGKTNEEEELEEEGKLLDVDETRRRRVDRTSTTRSCESWIWSEPTRGRGGFPKLLRAVVEEGREQELGGSVEEVEEGMDPVFLEVP